MYPTGDILTEYTLDDFRPAFVDLKSFDWHVRNRPTFWAEKDQRMFSWRLSGVHFQIGNTTIFSLVLFMYMNMFNWRHRHRLIDCCWHEQRLTTLCTAKNEGSKNSWAQGLWSINKYISYNKIKLNKIKKSFIHQSLLILTFWNPIIILWKKLSLEEDYVLLLLFSYKGKEVVQNFQKWVFVILPRARLTIKPKNACLGKRYHRNLLLAYSI